MAHKNFAIDPSRSFSRPLIRDLFHAKLFISFFLCHIIFVSLRFFFVIFVFLFDRQVFVKTFSARKPIRKPYAESRKNKEPRKHAKFNTSLVLASPSTLFVVLLRNNLSWLYRCNIIRVGLGNCPSGLVSERHLSA